VLGKTWVYPYGFTLSAAPSKLCLGYVGRDGYGTRRTVCPEANNRHQYCQRLVHWRWGFESRHIVAMIVALSSYMEVSYRNYGNNSTH
jgi:hypothetical protein